MELNWRNITQIRRRILLPLSGRIIYVVEHTRTILVVLLIAFRFCPYAPRQLETGPVTVTSSQSQLCSRLELIFAASIKFRHMVVWWELDKT